LIFRKPARREAMELELKRLWPNSEATTGVLWIDGVQKYFTLERAPSDPLRIPAGRYQVTMYPSPKFGRLMPLLNGVPGRSDIEMHWGNSPHNSEGCILVGMKRQDDHTILETREAVAGLIAQIEAAPDSVWITVEDTFPLIPTDTPQILT
jgi:hypothetical protein